MSTDLKGELASLRIDRTRKAGSRWRWSLFFFVPVVLGLAVLYGLRVRQALAAPEVETTAAVVSILAPGTQVPGTPILTASGYVVARRKAVVSAKIQGRLSWLGVEEGSQVGDGEVIARLESSDYEASVLRSKAAVLRAEADLAENQRQLRVADRLAQEEVLGTDQRDAAASRVKIAEAQLAQANADLAYSEAQLANTRIRAPFAGIVVKKMAEVGESVAPIPPGVNISTASGAIVALADLATLEVEADVAEANVAKVANGQPAEVTVEAIPDRRYNAVLRQVIPTADRTKATVMVKVTILDKDKDLKPEMSAKVTFLELERPAPDRPAATAERQVTAPKDAVVSRDGQPTVFEVREGKALARRVKTGAELQGRVVIREGLRGGEILVSRPPETLKDGDHVRLKG